MNTVNLIGRLTKDPDFRSIERKKDEDLSQATFTLAVDRNGDDADFIRCIAYGKTAETIEQYCVKGQRVGVTGHLRSGSYEHKDGYTVYTLDVIVDRFDFADGNKREDNDKPAARGGRGGKR